MSDQEASLQTTAPLQAGMQGPGTQAPPVPPDPTTVQVSLENFAVSYTTYQNRTLMAGFMAYARAQGMDHNLQDAWITEFNTFSAAPVADAVGAVLTPAEGPAAPRGWAPGRAQAVAPRMRLPLTASERVTGPSGLRR